MGYEYSYLLGNKLSMMHVCLQGQESKHDAEK